MAINRIAFTVLITAALLLAFGCASDTTSRSPGINNYIQGAIANQKGDQERALSSLQSAVDQDPRLTMARIKLGDLYRLREEYLKSAEQYEVVVQLDPYEAKNFYYLGVAYQFLERLDDAAASYQKALKLDPRDPAANMNLGVVYLALSKPESAIKYLENATVLNSKSAAAHANYAVGLTNLGKYPEAESAFRRSLDINPHQPQTTLNLAAVLLRQKKGVEAAAVMKEVVREANTPLAHKRYGDALAQCKQYDESITEYQAALKLDPGYYAALNEIGWAWICKYKDGAELDESQRKAAVEAWKKSLQLNPRQPTIDTVLKLWDEPRKK